MLGENQSRILKLYLSLVQRLLREIQRLFRVHQHILYTHTVNSEIPQVRTYLHTLKRIWVHIYA